MPEIIKNRTIRPSTRLHTSVNYKIDTKNVSAADTLIVNIDHEKTEFTKRYSFRGADVADRDSIHFKVTNTEEGISLEWSGAQPVGVPKPTIIKLEPEWFTMGYYVYVVAMKHKGKRYFYVGMTGDRKHKTARSPFYRMNGHFSLLESSTQNQVIKGIKKLEPDTAVEDILGSMEFIYYAYMLAPFIKGNDENHHAQRKYAEQVESSLINKMKTIYGGGHIFNKHKSVKNHTQTDAMAEEILMDFKQRIR